MNNVIEDLIRKKIDYPIHASLETQISHCCGSFHLSFEINQMSHGITQWFCKQQDESPLIIIHYCSTSYHY